MIPPFPLLIIYYGRSLLIAPLDGAYDLTRVSPFLAYAANEVPGYVSMREESSLMLLPVTSVWVRTYTSMTTQLIRKTRHANVSLRQLPRELCTDEPEESRTLLLTSRPPVSSIYRCPP